MKQFRGTKKVYENSEFIVIQAEGSFIVVNKFKPFKQGHTHITGFDTAMWLTRLSRKHVIPKKISGYLLEGLIRISRDETYVKQLLDIQSGV